MYTRQDWEWLAASSDYQAAIAIKQLLQQEKFMEASVGLDILLESMGKSKKLALKSQLIRLMCHVIKWKCQPQLRSASWAVTIMSARDEIADLQEEIPSLNAEFIKSIWEQCLSKAIKTAALEINQQPTITSLTWAEVFNDEYTTLEF